MPLIGKLINWLFFTVLIATAPILIYGYNRHIAGVGVSLGALLGKGELMLISCALAAGGIGEMLASGPEAKVRKLICGGACFAIVALSCGAYGSVSHLLDSKAIYDSQNLAMESIWLFIFTIVSSFSCICLAHEHRS